MDKNYIINIKSDKNIFNSKSALSKFKNIIKNNWNNKNNVINNIFYDYVNPTYTYTINIINENEIDINFELKCNQEINTSKKTLNFILDKELKSIVPKNIISLYLSLKKNRNMNINTILDPNTIFKNPEYYKLIIPQTLNKMKSMKSSNSMCMSNNIYTKYLNEIYNVLIKTNNNNIDNTSNNNNNIDNTNNNTNNNIDNTDNKFIVKNINNNEDTEEENETEKDEDTEEEKDNYSTDENDIEKVDNADIIYID